MIHQCHVNEPHGQTQMNGRCRHDSQFAKQSSACKDDIECHANQSCRGGCGGITQLIPDHSLCKNELDKETQRQNTCNARASHVKVVGSIVPVDGRVTFKTPWEFRIRTIGRMKVYRYTGFEIFFGKLEPDHAHAGKTVGQSSNGQRQVGHQGLSPIHALV